MKLNYQKVKIIWEHDACLIKIAKILFAKDIINFIAVIKLIVSYIIWVHI